MKSKYKLMVGASALAKSVIAGLMIANQIKKGKMEKFAQQVEQNKKYVNNLKEYMHQKVPVSADDIDARLNQMIGDYEDLATDLRNREVAGQRVKKELELERAEQVAVEKEQAYIDKTYNSITKGAEESVLVYKNYFEHERIAVLLDNPEWRKSHNIPQDSKLGQLCTIEKENGVSVYPYKDSSARYRISGLSLFRYGLYGVT